MRRFFRLRRTTKASMTLNMSPIPGSLVRFSILIATIWTSIGCDSDSFVPPPPEELRAASGSMADVGTGGTARPAMPTPAKAVEVILSRHNATDAEVLISAARTQGGHEKTRVKVATLGETESASRQAELVREAVSKHPLALVLEPADPSDPSLAAAVREARVAGIPVVLIGRELTGAPGAESAQADTSGGKVAASASPAQIKGAPGSPGAHPAPIVLVTTSPFTITAKQLVASAIRNSKNSGLDPHQSAVLLLDTTSDMFVEDRLTAVRDALKAAGITKIQEIRFERDNTLAAKRLTEFLTANPNLVLIFSLDHQSFIANREVRTKLVETHPMISAGFAADEQLAHTAAYGEFAALAEFVPTRLIRRAISTAVAVAQGKEFQRPIEVPIILHDSPANTGADNVPQYKGKKKLPVSDERSKAIIR
jgi:ABC-type sugar transport system substrate-binding protein